MFLDNLCIFRSNRKDVAHIYKTKANHQIFYFPLLNHIKKRRVGLLNIFFIPAHSS